MDWLGHMLKEETVQHMKHSAKYVDNSIIIHLFEEHKMYEFPRTHNHRQKKRIMKAEMIYSSSESSDDEFLAQSVGHLRVKAVKEIK